MNAQSLVTCIVDQHIFFRYTWATNFILPIYIDDIFHVDGDLDMIEQAKKYQEAHFIVCDLGKPSCALESNMHINVQG